MEKQDMLGNYLISIGSKYEFSMSILFNNLFS